MADSSKHTHEALSKALDIKEATMGPDGDNSCHIHASEKEAVRELTEEQLQKEFRAPTPNHDALDKAIQLQDKFKENHMDLSEEEKLWRDKMDEAVAEVEK